MSIYIHKNNQQAGPFEESRVLEMLKKGQLSLNDMAIRYGETNWQSLGSLFANQPVASATAFASNSQTLAAYPKKGGFRRVLGVCMLVIGILMLLVGSYFSYNLFTASERPVFCQWEERDFQELQAAYAIYQKYKDNESLAKFQSLNKIVESEGRDCAAAIDSMKRYRILFSATTIIGFFIALIGFFLRIFR